MKNKNNAKAQWMLFLDNPNSKEVREIMEKNDEIKEATVVVKQMSEDEKMQRLAFLREKAILDEKEIYATATEKGIEEGTRKAKEEIIKKLKGINMPIEQIAGIVELDVSDVKRILKI